MAVIITDEEKREILEKELEEKKKEQKFFSFLRNGHFADEYIAKAAYKKKGASI